MESWEIESKSKIDFQNLIYLDCSKVKQVIFKLSKFFQENMIKRILKRAESSNRTDDNIISLEKRFVIFENETKPIIEYYSQLNKVIKAI